MGGLENLINEVIKIYSLLGSLPAAHCQTPTARPSPGAVL